MKPILAIIPYTGSEKLVLMTAAMIAELASTVESDTSVMSVANAPSRRLTYEERGGSPFELIAPRNLGFGPGVNAGINGRDWHGDVLVLNNDLGFPQREWLALLRTQQAEDEKEEMRYIYAPRTNCTATPEACKDGPEDKPAQRVRQVSAYCWLVPAKMQLLMRERNKGDLFPREFPNYGSDDAAAAWARKLFGKTPFKVVHRAFVKHAKGQTAKETGDRPGDPAVLKRLRAYLRGNGLT